MKYFLEDLQQLESFYSKQLLNKKYTIMFSVGWVNMSNEEIC